MAIQPVDIAGSFARGTQAGQQFRQMENQGRLAQLYQENFAQGIPTTPEARNQFIGAAAAVDPDTAVKWTQAFSAMDTQAREQAKLLSERAGKAAATVLQLPPEQRAAAYGQLQQRMPDVFDTPFSEASLMGVINEARTVDQIMADMNKAPQTRERMAGTTLVQEQFNPTTRTWEVVGSGPRFAPQQPDQTLVEVYDPNSPTGTRMVPRSQAAGLPGKPPASQMQITGYDTEGRPLIQIGGAGKPGNAGMAQPTVNKVEEAMLGNTGRLERLNTIASQFKPEYLQIPDRVATGGLALWERMGGTLSPEQQRQVSDYATFTANAYNELVQTLKEMSGAAVTPQEAERLLKVIPDPASDSPTQFKAKLDGALRAVRMANARLAYIRRNGLDLENFGGVSLDNMPQLINQRGAAIEAEVRAANPNASEDQIDAQVAQQLNAEFGM